MDVKSFMYGSIAGTCGILTSHPFDTYKTLLQTTTINNKSNFSKSLSFTHLYRGMDKACLSMAMEKCLVFGGYSTAKKYTNNNFIAGSFAGLLASLVVTPCERLKILYQTNPQINISNFKNKNIFYFYQGFGVTMTREVPGFGIYFTVYNYLKNKYNNNNIYQSFLFGAIAGSFAWIFIYPQDTIKTILQSSNNKNEPINEIFKKLTINGYSKLYTGFSYCLMRVIPLHGTVFMTMELLQKYLN